MTTRIYVDPNSIHANRHDGGNRPVFTVKDEHCYRRGNHVAIAGPSRLVYSKEKPPGLEGASAWVETEGEVLVGSSAAFLVGSDPGDEG